MNFADDHTRHVAVGATGPLPGRGCRIESEPAASPIAIVGERYTAKRAGRARIACGGDVSDVEASEPTRLALLVGQDQDRYYLSVHAYDQNGLALALGDASDVRWELSPEPRATPRAPRRRSTSIIRARRTDAAA